MTKRTPQTWTITFVNEPSDAPCEVKVRKLLKYALRALGLKCLGYRSGNVLSEHYRMILERDKTSPQPGQRGAAEGPVMPKHPSSPGTRQIACNRKESGIDEKITIASKLQTITRRSAGRAGSANDSQRDESDEDHDREKTNDRHKSLSHKGNFSHLGDFVPNVDDEVTSLFD